MADALLLSVSSSPVSGISISGSKSGKTDYEADIPKGQQATLSAPASVNVKGADHVFDRWALDDVPQAEGVSGLTVQMDADRDARALYNVVPHTLNVQSDPVVGVQIAGLDGCTTNYCGSVADLLRLHGPDRDRQHGAGEGEGEGQSHLGHDADRHLRHDRAGGALPDPSDADIVLERGSKVGVEFAALNLPKGYPVQVLLVKGGTDVWMLSDGTRKTPWRWKVGRAEKDEDPYPDGDDYTIVVSALDGAVLAESANPFAIATVDSLEIIGPDVVQSGGDLQQYTCIAHYGFGPDVAVTQDVKWHTTGKKYAKVNRTDLMATKPVPEEMPCAVTATYGKGKSALTGGLEISLTP